MINGLEIALLVIAAWIIAMFALAGRISKTRNFSVYGPFLMLKATKNRGILDKLSSEKSPKTFSRISVGLVLLFLFLGIALLLYESYLATQIRVIASPPLSYYLVLPGINPAIPVVYGSVALIFAVVIHELMHGITARKHGLPVKSVGVLFMIIPVGAFVEPEQEALMAADPIVRRRVFAVGPAINIVIAIICFLLLVLVLMPSVHAIHDGMYVQSVDGNAYTSTAISPGSEIISFGPYSGNNLSVDFLNSSIFPGTMTATSYMQGGILKNTQLPAGLVVDSTTAGFPAAGAITPGCIFVSIDNHVIYNQASLTAVLDSIPPKSTVNITMVNVSSSTHAAKYSNFSLVTGSKYSYYQQYEPGYNSPAYQNQSFLGVVVSYLGLGGCSIECAKQTVFGADAIYGGTAGMFTTLALPFQGLSPVPAPMTLLFTTPFYAPAFWVVMNMLFWVFWLSFLLGLVNALPIFITDGGQFLKDTLFIFGRRRKIKLLSDEKKAGLISNYLGLFIVFLIFWELLIPRFV